MAVRIQAASELRQCRLLGGLIITILLFEPLPYPSAVILIPSDRAMAITALLCVTIYSYGEGTYLRNCQARRRRNGTKAEEVSRMTIKLFGMLEVKCREERCARISL